MGGILTSRELAVVIWTVAFLTVGLFKKEIRTFFRLVFHTAFTKAPTLALFGSAASYLLLLATLTAYFSDTARPHVSLIFWAVSAFLPTIIRLTEIEKDVSKIWTWVGSFIGFTAVAELITTAYTFSLFVELIIIPVLFSVSILYVFTESRDGARAANGCASAGLIMILLTLAARSVWGMIYDTEVFWSWDTGIEFFTPAAFGLLSVPYLLFWVAVLRIDNLRQAIRFAVEDRELRDRALKIALSYSFLNRKQMLAFKREIAQAKPKTFEDLRAAMRSAVEIEQRVKEQPETPAGKGWNPDKAAEFLRGLGIVTGPYCRAQWNREIWEAYASEKVRKNDFDSPTICYSIVGEKFCAKSLVLKCTTLSADRRDDARFSFQKAFLMLWKEAMGDALPDGLDNAVLEFKDFTSDFDEKQVEFRIQEEDGKFPISEYRLEIYVAGWQSEI